MDHVTVASSLQWAFNIVATGTMGTVLATMIKGKADQKLQIKQLEAAQKIADQTGIRAEDVQRDVRQKQYDERADREYKSICDNRDWWRSECLRFQGLLEERDRKWTEIGTTYSEALSIVTLFKDRMAKGEPIQLLSANETHLLTGSDTNLFTPQ